MARHLSTLFIVIGFVSGAPLTAQESSTDSLLSDYEAALDAAFGHVSGIPGPMLIIRKIPSFTPESEIVITTENRHVLVSHVTLESQLWGTLHILSGSRKPSRQEIVARAAAVPVKRAVVELPEQEILNALAMLTYIDRSFDPKCQFLKKDGSCNEVFALDGQDYELITAGGTKRTTVWDTSGTDLISANQALLDWMLNLEKIVITEKESAGQR